MCSTITADSDVCREGSNLPKSLAHEGHAAGKAVSTNLYAEKLAALRRGAHACGAIVQPPSSRVAQLVCTYFEALECLFSTEGNLA